MISLSEKWVKFTNVIRYVKCPTTASKYRKSKSLLDKYEKYLHWIITFIPNKTIQSRFVLCKIWCSSFENYLSRLCDCLIHNLHLHISKYLRIIMSAIHQNAYNFDFDLCQSLYHEHHYSHNGAWSCRMIWQNYCVSQIVIHSERKDNRSCFCISGGTLIRTDHVQY